MTAGWTAGSGAQATGKKWQPGGSVTGLDLGKVLSSDAFRVRGENRSQSIYAFPF